MSTREQINKYPFRIHKNLSVRNYGLDQILPNYIQIPTVPPPLHPHTCINLLFFFCHNERGKKKENINFMLHAVLNFG